MINFYGSFIEWLPYVSIWLIAQSFINTFIFWVKKIKNPDKFDSSRMDLADLLLYSVYLILGVSMIWYVSQFRLIIFYIVLLLGLSVSASTYFIPLEKIKRISYSYHIPKIHLEGWHKAFSPFFLFILGMIGLVISVVIQ